MGISTAASSALGAISQDQWSDYMQHFQPYENQLIQYAQNTALPGQNMQTALGLQQGANAQAGGIQERQLAQFDTTLNPDEAGAAAKSTGINNALANVQAANQAKDVTVADQMAVMGAPTTGITGAL
jgi:hypothetical protein